MVDILIQGDDARTAAQAMREAIREIFETDPIQSTTGGGTPGTRQFDPYTFVLTIPPAIFYAERLAEQLRIGERWRQFTARAKKEADATQAQFLVDVGDGKHIPLEQAPPEKIREALIALQERYPKS
jgi:hypothetical protein